MRERERERERGRRDTEEREEGLSTLIIVYRKYVTNFIALRNLLYHSNTANNSLKEGKPFFLSKSALAYLGGIYFFFCVTAPPPIKDVC